MELLRTVPYLHALAYVRDQFFSSIRTQQLCNVCFVFDERTAVRGQGERVSSAEAESIGEELGPRASKSLRKRLQQSLAQHQQLDPVVDNWVAGRSEDQQQVLPTQNT